MERAVTVLPEPDSPTSATISPCPTCRFTPRTACTNPPSVSNPTLRFSMLTRLMVRSAACGLHIFHLVHALSVVAIESSTVGRLLLAANAHTWAGEITACPQQQQHAQHPQT